MKLAFKKLRCINLFIVMQFLYSLPAFAINDPTLTQPLLGSSGQVFVNATSTVTDQPNPFLTIEQTHIIHNMVSAGIEEESKYFIVSDFTATLKLHIIQYDKNLQVIEETDQNFVIDYKKGEGVTSKAVQYFAFKNASQVKVTITSIDKNVGWDVAKVLRIDNTLTATRDYLFNCTAAIKGLTTVLDNANNELSASWQNPHTGLTEYDLEWAWIDESALISYQDNNQFTAEKIFNNNATRVTISNIAYNIPLLYDGQGRLFVRVRPAQIKQDGQRIEGAWTWQNAGQPVYYIYNGHENFLNWQASTSFAEEGKRKSVVQYFDGTLRNRQTVTKDNSTNTTIVAESFYDYQGRPVIQVLPAPTLNNIIQYSQNFNKAVNFSGYPKWAYDKLTPNMGICANPAQAFANTTGTSQYYSPNNEKAKLPGNNPDKYIPDAEGYPFTETRFTPDGRVAAQGGVGINHQLGSGHETKYMYESPEQTELDALFGTDAGYAPHYFKNFVKDANGQYSVSYTDMHGRTVATALAGESPTNLDALTGILPKNLTKQLIDEQTNTIAGQSIITTKSLAVPKAGLYKFNYSFLEPEQLTLLNCNKEAICYDCLYNLKVTITSDCDSDGFPVVISDSNFTLKENLFDPQCNDKNKTTGFFNKNFEVQLPEGAYTITKVLTLSDSAKNIYREVFIANNTCKTFQEFYDTEYKLLIEKSSCEITCESCTENIGKDLVAFTKKFIQQSGMEEPLPDDIKAQLKTAYAEALKNCDQICNTTDDKGMDAIKSIREIMLIDMTPPYGQYAKPAETNKPFNIFGFKPNKFIPYIKLTKTYKDEFGVLEVTDPAALSAADFTAQFKPSWAEQLLVYHPEYCKLKATEEKLPSTYQFEALLNKTNNWNDAKKAGYITTVNNVVNIINEDPFFSGVGFLLKKAMQDKMLKYTTTKGKEGCPPTGEISFSMWQLAQSSVFCRNLSVEGCAASEQNKCLLATPALPPSDATGCSTDYDMAWKNFRSLYLSERKKFISQYLINTCGSDVDKIIESQKFQLRFIDYGNIKYNNLNEDNTDLNAFFNLLAQGNAEAKDKAKELAKEQYKITCQGYADSWIAQLEQCPAVGTITAQDAAWLTSRLVDICTGGSDENHYLGASSLPPDAEPIIDNGNLYTEFPDVIKVFLKNKGIAINELCHPYLITTPAPYDKQAVATDQLVITKPDSCMCERLNELKAQHEKALKSGFYGTLSEFVNAQHGTNITQENINTLIDLCNGKSQCLFLPEPIAVPPLFQCNAPQKPCINCEDYQEFKKGFTSLFNKQAPIENPQTQEEIDLNIAFEHFANSKTGFGKSWQDYIDFEQKCNKSCSDIEILGNTFYTNFIEPESGFVDLDMRTFAGNKTPADGPKGVFDINKNLIGNTINGTVNQVNQSYIAIWNSSPANQAIGTLSLINSKFRLMLKPGQKAPCDGITGMRYYQFDAPVDTLDAVITNLGSFISFGDGKNIKVDGAFNSPETKVDMTYASANRAYFPFFYVAHIYPDKLQKTITVYHTDTNGIVGFDNYLNGKFAQSLSKLKNLRGYAPRHCLSLHFHSTQEPTLNTLNGFLNKDEISGLEFIHFISGDNEITPFKNYNFGSLKKYNTIKYIKMQNGSPLALESVLPDIAKNFPNLTVAEILGTTIPAVLNFSLPELKGGILSNLNTTEQVDLILNQVAFSTTKDTGIIWLLNCPKRSVASDAAVQTLNLKHWTITTPGENINPNLWKQAAAETLYNFYTLYPLTNVFTEWYNEKNNTSYNYHQLKAVLKDKYGYEADFCDYKKLNCLLEAPMLCGLSEPIFKPIPQDNAPCKDLPKMAYTVAEEKWTVYQDSINNIFDTAYYNKCMKAKDMESLTVSYTNNEHHYTLYYYDQAGNLVKTIPPAGVDARHSDAAFLDKVKAARLNVKNGQAEAVNKVVPNHTLVTNYRYNTLNQVVAQQTPDAGNSKFWYDVLGRLVVSQNSQQQITNKYSYTLYDALGRITEVGQKPQAVNSMSQTVSQNITALNNWINVNGGIKEQLTNTFYDQPYEPFMIPNSILTQHNLRNRVSYSTVKNLATDPLHYAATFYAYDVHGNVDTLLQDLNFGVMKATGNRFKKIAYDYDLISGKVNKVSYQPGLADEFYHKYFYDAENRLTDVYTSRDSLTYEKDSRYNYYKHGPLARQIIGQNQVQGIDYAYTIQGWLKGINSTQVGDGKFDMGADGLKVGNVPNPVALDGFGFALHYFSTANAKDYKPIGGGQPFANAAAAGFGFVPLYNGNIAAMSVNTPKLGEPLLFTYRYDQLQRLTKTNTYKGLNPNTNNWNVVSIDDYREELSYDANGNIQTYKRNGKADKLDMDKMTYQYPKDINGNILNNRLRYVHDEVNAANYAEDIDSQTPLTVAQVKVEKLPEQQTDNYRYDAIGNLIQDKKEGINKINWNVYGKIESIEKQNSTITYKYDASGNRISKTVGDAVTVYSRDATGNVMSTYVINDTVNNGNLTQSEVDMYGSSMLGVDELNMDVHVPAKATDESRAKKFGYKKYQLTNHRGDVLAVVGEHKTQHDDNNDGIIDRYTAQVLHATDYSSFGAALPGRSFNPSGYKLGHSGMEKSNEIYGEGNAYNFGSRIQDPRLGRWFSPDALQKKYPAWSPYNYVMNSPLKLKDDDGEDVIVTISGTSIIFSSTIYVTGPGATDVAKNANESYSQFSKAALQNRTYKDAEGKIYEVQIKMNYVAVNPADPKDLNAAAYNSTLNDKVGGSGNNILNLTNNVNKLVEGTRANAGHAAGKNYENTREDFIAGNGRIQSKPVNGVGNMAWLNQDKSATSNGVTAIHETFHNFGLGDRYIEKVLYKWESSVGTIKSGIGQMTVSAPGFSGDMMSIGKGALSSFSQEHIDNLAAKALELSKTKGNNFVMSQEVDHTRSTDTDKAPKEFTEGKTKYTKQ